MTSRPTHRPPRPPVDLVASRAAAPIAEVAAIVTESANAFDDPLVRGSITGADGNREFLLCLRKET